MTIARLHGHGRLYIGTKALGTVEYDLTVTTGADGTHTAGGTLKGDPDVLHRAQQAREVRLEREYGGAVRLAPAEFDFISQSLGVLSIGPVLDGGDKLTPEGREG